MALQHAEPGEVVDLRPLGEGLSEAKSTAIDRTSSFQVMRLIVLAGSEMPTHQVEGRVMLQCLEGKVQIGLGRSSPELGAGDWLYLEGNEPHSVTGIEDASMLLTILFDG